MQFSMLDARFSILNSQFLLSASRFLVFTICSLLFFLFFSFAAANIIDNDLLPSIAAVDDVYIASLVHGHNHNHNGNGNGNGHGNGNQHLHHNNAAQFDNALDELLDEQVDETTYPPPVFDFGMPRNITARTGHTAAINCRVENLRDKSVSQVFSPYHKNVFFRSIYFSFLFFSFFYAFLTIAQANIDLDFGVSQAENQLTAKVHFFLWFTIFLRTVCSATRIVFRFRFHCAHLSAGLLLIFLLD